jgi:hypothetical protein
MPISRAVVLSGLIFLVLAASSSASIVPDYVNPLYPPRPSIYGVAHFGPVRGDIQIVLTETGVWHSIAGFSTLISLNFDLQKLLNPFYVG